MEVECLAGETCGEKGDEEETVQVVPGAAGGPPVDEAERSADGDGGDHLEADNSDDACGAASPDAPLAHLHADADHQLQKPSAQLLAQRDADLFDNIVKHDLQNTWSWWLYKDNGYRGSGNDWMANMLNLYTFSTVEDFWALYNHIQRPSLLPDKIDYYVFKSHIKPMWEDSFNEKGGRFIFLLKKDASKQYIDTYWMQILMLLVGEDLDDLSDEISGAVVMIRTNLNKVAIWTQRKDNSNRWRDLLRTKLQLPNSIELKFEPHDDLKTFSARSRKPAKHQP